MKTRAWLTFALGLLAGAVLAGTVAGASFGRLSLQLCPLPGTPVSQPAAGPGTTEVSLFSSFRRSREPLPLVFGLVGGAAAVVTEAIRAFLHFFPSEQEVEAWIAEHPGSRALTLAAAFELGWHKNRLQYPDVML